MKTLRLMVFAAMTAISVIACKKAETPEPGGNPEKPETLEAKILTFKIKDYPYEAKVFEEDKYIEIPYGNEDDRALLKTGIAEVTLSDQATVTQDLSKPMDFTQEVKIEVKSGDGKITQTYSVQSKEAQIQDKVVQVWDKNYADLQIAGEPILGNGIVAFSGSNIVLFNKDVFDLEGNKVGTLNMEGSGIINKNILNMTNDTNGILVASVGVNASGSTPANIDDISHSQLWAWVDGWNNPPKILTEADGSYAYMSITGDVKGASIFIHRAGVSATQQHHCYVIPDHNWGGEWGGQLGNCWNFFSTTYSSMDGNWGQMVSAATADRDGKFFIWDSAQDVGGEGKLTTMIYARQGMKGADTQLRGTLTGEYAGSYGYGNYSEGHVRAFQFNGTDYAAVSSAGWAAAYFTIQTSDPSAKYLLETTTFSIDAPRPTSAYFVDEKGTSYIVYVAHPGKVVLYQLTREVI